MEKIQNSNDEKYVFCSEEKLLSRIERYVNLDTPSGDAARINALCDVLCGELEIVGAHINRRHSAGGDIIEASCGDERRFALLLCHLDTVFPAGEAKKRPFSIENGEGGRILHGPGVLDMKSGAAMTVELLRDFIARPQDRIGIRALFTCDEEIGSENSREIICRLAKESLFTVCMEPSKPGFCTVARKGLSAFRINAYGKSAHSGVNYALGHSAIEGICRAVALIYELRDDEKSLSVNIGDIYGGVGGGKGKFNIIADSASAAGEVRCYDGALLALTLDKIGEICARVERGVGGIRTELIRYPGRPPMERSPRSDILYECAEKAAVSHGLALGARVHGGGSDGSFASALGTPVIDGMGAEGENSHTAEEYVLCDTLFRRMMTCSDAIRDAASML